jgi:putative transposase
LAYAWRVEVAHGHLLRSRRLARSFENTVRSGTAWVQAAAIGGVLRVLTA